MIKYTVVLLCLLVAVRADDSLAGEDHAAHEIFADELDSELAEIAKRENGLDASEEVVFDSVALTEQDANDDAEEGAEDDDDILNDTEGSDDFENGDRQSRRGGRRSSRRISRRDRKSGRRSVNENRGDRLSPPSNDEYRGHRGSMRDRGHKVRLGRRPGVARENEDKSDAPTVSEIVLVMEPGTSSVDMPNEPMDEEERHRGRGHRGPGRGHRRHRPDPHRHGRRCRKHRRGESDQEPESAPHRTCIGEGCDKVPYLLPIENESVTEQNAIEEVSTPSSVWSWWS